MNTFGDRLREARQALRKTQDVVADEVGVTKSAVSSWENNRDTPSLDKLPGLRAALEISLDELVCGPLPATPPAAPSGKRLATAEPVAPDYLHRYPAQVTVEERRFLAKFRKLGSDKRGALLKLLD
ncbi:MAG: helix-turn-helix domain-containing protein [Pseudomonas sp.]